MREDCRARPPRTRPNPLETRSRRCGEWAHMGGRAEATGRARRGRSPLPDGAVGVVAWGFHGWRERRHDTPMPSQTLIDTRRLADDIVAALDAHAADLDAAAESRLRRDLRQGERWPGVAALLGVTARRVRRTLEAYVAAEAALEAERADDIAPRAARDAEAQAVYQQLRKLKGAVDALYDEATVRRLRLPAELPRDPARLAAAAEAVLAALSTTKLPAPAVEGIGRVDVAAWAEALRGPHGRLEAARAKLNREDKELATALEARDRAQAALSEAMVEALALARAVAALADRDSLFDGLRATPGDGGARPADPVTPTPDGGPSPTRPTS